MPDIGEQYNMEHVLIGSCAKRRVAKIQCYLVLLHFPSELKIREMSAKKKKKKHMMMYPLTDQSGADFFQGFCEFISCSLPVNILSGRLFGVKVNSTCDFKK